MSIFLLLFKLLMGLLVFAGIIATFVLWIMSIVQIFQRSDLKNSKWLWLVLFIFTGSIGSIVYFFAEGKKKLGVINLLALLCPLILLPVYAIVTFATSQLSLVQ